MIQSASPSIWKRMKIPTGKKYDVSQHWRASQWSDMAEYRMRAEMLATKYARRKRPSHFHRPIGFFPSFIISPTIPLTDGSTAYRSAAG
jgi:hypothetical protein